MHGLYTQWYRDSVAFLCSSLFVIAWNITDFEEKVENACFSGNKINSGDKALCSMDTCHKGTSSK